LWPFLRLYVPLSLNDPMDMKTLIQNALIINEGKKFQGYVIINGEFIEKVVAGDFPTERRKCIV
jgi:hypothetical protein